MVGFGLTVLVQPTRPRTVFGVSLCEHMGGILVLDFTKSEREKERKKGGGTELIVGDYYTHS